MEPLSIAGLCAGAGALYCLTEARCYTVRRLDVAGPSAANGMRVLHISDLHIAPWDVDRVHWVSTLDRLAPDLIIASGDFLAHRDSVPHVARALQPLLKRPGVFVLGSNDFYAPRLKNPFAYLGKNTKRILGASLPTAQLQGVLESDGWLDLNNAKGSLTLSGVNIEFRGTGDAHIDLDDYSKVAGQWTDAAQFRVAVTHAPYSRVLRAIAADSPDIIFAGHTHGGQVTLPFVTALTTNCDLPVKQARGLSTVPGPVGNIPLHVSAGVGTSPIFPVRLGCRPEATLITVRS